MLRAQKTASSQGCDDGDDFAIEAAWGCDNEAPCSMEATAQQQQQQRACLLSATAKLAACEGSKGILAEENAQLRVLLAEFEADEPQGGLAEKVDRLSARVGELAASGLALQHGLEEQAAALQARLLPGLLVHQCVAAAA